jgi:hypothetical protein
VKYDEHFYDELIEHQDHDLICEQLSNACKRMADKEKVQGDTLLYQAWSQEADQFKTLADKFTAGEFYRIDITQ